MESLVLINIIYILLIILLVVLIVLGMKCIFAMDEVNKSLKDVNEKIHSLDTIFDLIDILNKYLEGFNSGLVSNLTKIGKFFKKIKGGDDDE